MFETLGFFVAVLMQGSQKKLSSSRSFFFFVRGSERKSIKMPIDMCVYVRVGVCV